MIKANQFNIASVVEKEAYENILNDHLCNIKHKETFKDMKAGEVIVYLEWEDFRNIKND